MVTQFLQRQNGSIAYDLRGNGPLVVLSPSLGDIRGEYRTLAPQLAEAGYRVATMDLRGHGESSTGWPNYSIAGVGADMLALIRHLEAGPAAIVGTSFSAGAAVWAAAEAPELVSGLVLVGAFVRNTMSPILAKLLFSPLFSGPWGAAAWIKYFRTLFPTQPPQDFESYLDELKANLNEPGRLKAVRAMMTASKDESEVRLEKVATPTLVLMGSKDPDFSDPEAEASLVATRLNGRYEMIVGAGHYPHAEMPEQTAEHIRAFLEALQPQKELAHAG